jgi:AcrR family transcriptional regulator
MRTPRVDIGRIRREQIVEAAVGVITERGIQHLSLSAIEKRAGMSRGQLTYYFRAKEDILLAVFDRLLALLYERVGRQATESGVNPCQGSAWEWVQHLLTSVLLKPRASPEFDCLQHTFLSQIAHREDFRRRLATLYEEWRSRMGQGLARDLAPGAHVSPRALAAFVQAMLHGLSVQLAADPNAFDRQEMLSLCLGLLGPLFPSGSKPDKKRPPLSKKNGFLRKAHSSDPSPPYSATAGR